MEDVLRYIESHQEKFLAELQELLRIPSISADPAHREDVLRCSRFLADHLRGIGLSVEVFQTPGNPILFASTPVIPAAPTVLFYGHYDVQPVDPLDLWQSPPFAADIRNGNIYARGASDDKGPVFAHMKGVEAFLRTRGTLPLNFRFFIEGEEEVGSAHLDPFIAAHRELLRADVVVISDTTQFAPGVPAVTYGLRGLAYVEVSLQGPSHDLHSGSFGGTVPNPAGILVDVLSRFKDERGAIRIPGFYDKVLPIASWEREMYDSLPFHAEEYRALTGVRKLRTEEGFTPLECRWARPTLDINGLYGGYAGPGAKTIIPARAGAKVSMRLVPDQDPEEIAALFTRYVLSLCPQDVSVEIKNLHGGKPVLMDVNSPWMKAARTAISKGFGKAPVLTREGGSIPVVATFKEVLQLDSLMLGFGRPDDGAHSPNEKLCLDDFYRGILTSAHLIDELGRTTAES